MPTERDMLRAGGHPFFERMRTLRQLFFSFEQAEDARSGRCQDAEIELRLRARTGSVGEYEPEAQIDFGIETCIMQTMHRLCQIVLLYSTFESFCSGTLGAGTPWQISKEFVQRASKGPRKERRNFIIGVLEEAQGAGMQSIVWPAGRSSVEMFVALRGHLVHEGLEVNAKLRERVLPFVEGVPEIPGVSATDKLQSFGESGSLIQIPRAFVSKMFSVLEELGAALIVPVDHEAPDVNESIAELFRRARLGEQ